MFKRKKFKRIMLKLSGEVLEGNKDSGIDFNVIDEFCLEIKKIVSAGVQVAIVIGGGNFWRYRDFKDSYLDRVHSDYMGMIATLLNAMAMQQGFLKCGVKARVLSALPVDSVMEKYNRDNGVNYLENEEVVICAGGTGSPFFTTDTAAALRALELNCDVLLKGTKVDYVYDKDPKKYKNAKKYEEMTYTEVLEKKLEVMDLSAVSMCLSGDLPVIVFNQQIPGNLSKVVKGEKIGTIIH
jgi:uridylate kinase